MSARAGRKQDASNSTRLVLTILVDRKELSLRELVLCFTSCKTFREVLDGRGFCIGTAWLCACLESGQRPAEILSKLRSARGSMAYDRPLSRVDQVTRFLLRHEGYRVRWGWAWAQLLYQEPDGGVLCEGVKKMLWMLKGRLIKELHKSTGYYPGLCNLQGHSDCLNSLAWSPDGKLVASGSYDMTIRIWDVATGKEAMGSLTGHSDRATSVAWSPDGKLVVSGSYDKTLRIWDVATGKEAMGPWTGHSNWVTSVAWSPDGKLVASGSSDKTVRIWDVATGKEAMGHFTGHSNDVASVAWSSGGKLVASGSYDMTIRIWDVATGREAMGPLKGHSNGVNSVAWSPDSKLVVSGSYDRTLRIWDVARGKEAMGPLTGHSDCVTCVSWSPDGKLVASGSSDKTVRIWDVATGKEAMGPFPGHLGWVMSVAWSPDSKLVASGSYDKTSRIWDVATGKEAMGPLTRHSGLVTTLAWSPDGKLVASCSIVDKHIRIWDVATGKEAMGPFLGAPLWGGAFWGLNHWSVAWSSDGKLVASGWYGKTIRIWNIVTGNEVMAPLTEICGPHSFRVGIEPEIRPLGVNVREASQDPMACTGNYCVTAEEDMVFIFHRGGHEEMEPVAMYRCPSRVNFVACRSPYLCAGCERGDVLFLDAPFLCEQPGI